MYFESDPDAVKRKLAVRLADAQEAVLELIPPDLRSIADAYHRCANRGEFYEWQRHVIDHVLKSARIIPATKSDPDRGPRAYCPLCKSGSSSSYGQEFPHPEGLERHLTNRGNTRGCTVIKVLFARARDHLNPWFQRQEEEEEAEKRRVLEERRKTEPLFTVGPGRDVLLDEDVGAYADRVSRGEPSLSWAVERLVTLGFAEHRNANVRAFTKRVGGHTVYADPRSRGQITFNVYADRDTDSKKLQRKASAPLRQSFEIKDAWCRELDKKLSERIAAAITNLEYLKNPRARKMAAGDEDARAP